MSGRVKDIDYLALSARIRGLIDTHLTGARMERFLAAKSDDEAQAVLTECGYPEFRLNDAVAMDKAIAEVEKATFDDMIDFAPDPAVIDVFRVPYDYHNCKALLKERATGVNADHMLMRNGRVDPETIRKAIQTTEIRLLPKTLSLALDEAWDVLDATDDPQLSEAVLDRATYAELREIADGT
ncbi:MAG: V-type ATPase subunit, partial [Firmicutes bacterium]|nr:V-type ATPase subunit [Bacillota bacterium]